MKILVTGGAGFIGSHFVERALDGLYPEISEIVVVDKLTYAGKKSNMKNFFQYKNFHFVQGDICDSSLINELVSSVDAVVNFAAESHVDRSIQDSSEFVMTNILGAAVLLNAAKNFKIRKFIQVSTDEVYGSVLKGSSKEDDLLLPNSPYSASKASADMLALSYFSTFGLNINITRCSNNYGPRQDLEKMIPKSITNLLKNKKIPVYGDGLNVRDWLFVSDHCDGVYLVLTKGVPGEIYNIGGGDERTNLELVEELLQVFGTSSEQIEFVEDRLGHDRRYSVDYSKIAYLGYSPKKQFQKGLIETVSWYERSLDPDWSKSNTFK
jgi:dTDP-glucose 4,6-dehydratase